MVDAHPKAETKTLHVDQQPLNTTRTIGLACNSESECFVFSVESWQDESTMRSLLSYVASFFCPLVLVATCVLPSKIRMQDLTRRKADCDETMTWEELSRWKFAPVNFIVYKYFRLIAVLLQLSWKQSQN